jgi:DUF2924 family protein
MAHHLGGRAPNHLPRWLLARLLAYRIQVAAFGGLDKQVLRAICRSGKAGDPAFEARPPQSREGVDLKTGTVLVREWQGKLEQVTVLEEGFGWKGEVYGSLSRVARAITGTTWNGHRFFGLRQPKAPACNCVSKSDLAGKRPIDVLKDVADGVASWVNVCATRAWTNGYRARSSLVFARASGGRAASPCRRASTRSASNSAMTGSASRRLPLTT